ncbi:Anaerobic sulfite reductase subunit A [Pseudodesulfovibrio hydrargyri]|uniref:Anaerobic sulfite reductase subunit A n=1 Tax=Pseudodesulfovibrio hydrargyri TaxID=2125990 RepID=A0A1J5N4F9_9BACT|nr:4Fe-4S dicluster domain-containing protein [Pseudodesulfovibrio hydrargyri]OIQ50507.1 Anaerobic sulfite reductase subunit A [Pseudodesulfovibrio hydrargyri]
MAAKFLAKDKLISWLAELSESNRTLVPHREGQAVVFREFDGDTVPELERRPTVPPKGAVFPQCEPLMTFKYEKNPEDPGKVSLNVKERKDETPTVVFGARGCDAAGFNCFDRVYVTDKVTDQNYLARRKNTLFVTEVCAKPATTCFCNWVGGGPADTAGADVQLTPLVNGWLVEGVTERGEALMDSLYLTDGADRETEAQEVKKAAEALMGEACDLSGAPEKLLALFDDKDFWEAVSDKCLSCGACTYICPTCYCFNVTDENCGLQGVRLRTWDNCMSYQFTAEASGHNPRPAKANRFKNRIGHKFGYYPSLHGGNIACVGCGRCIKSCPVSMDVREVVRNVIAAPVAQGDK